MADISKELAAIMAAVFGKDVRGSIHDAIKKINDATEVALLAGTDVSSTSSSTEGYFSGSLYINKDEWELWQCQQVSADTLQWVNLGKFGGRDGNAVTRIYKSGVDPDHANVDIYTIEYSDPLYSDTHFSVTNGIDGTHGSVWYKGTALNGTGSSTGFPGVATDFYLNSSTGRIYQCVQTGDGTTAVWDYVMQMSGGGSGASALEDLDDVTLTSEAINDILRYGIDPIKGAQWINVKGDVWTSPVDCFYGDTTKSFSGCDASRSYDAYFECPAGVQAPAIISMHTDENTPTTIVVTFKPVTEEQAGNTGSSTTSCHLKLRGVGD